MIGVFITRITRRTDVQQKTTQISFHNRQETIAGAGWEQLTTAVFCCMQLILLFQRFS
jgi:hypothetical protein